MPRAVAAGETDPRAVATLGSARLHATPDQFRDALGPCADLHPVYRRLLAMTLDELAVIEAHLRSLDEELARLLREHQAAVERLAAVAGLGVDSAQQAPLPIDSVAWCGRSCTTGSPMRNVDRPSLHSARIAALRR